MKARFFASLILSALIVAGSCVFLTALATAGPGLGGEIPMGAVWSLTGDAAVYGPSQKNASLMAVDEINKSGMLGGAKIKLIIEDDRSTKEGAIAAFENLIKKDKVIAILGPTLSNSAKAADPIAQESKVIVLGVSNTAGGIVEIGDFIFRDSLPESAVQPNTVQKTMDKLGYKKVAVMYGDDDVFTKGGYDVFKKVLEEKGIQVLTTETFKKKDTDFSAQLTKIKGLNPDQIIVSALAEEAAGIMSQGRQLGIAESVHFIGGNGFNSPKLAQLAGQFAEGAISGAAWFIGNDTPGNKAFVEAYTSRYGTNPDQFAAQAYAGVYILAHAVKTANSSDSKAMRDALAAIRDLDTVLGKFSFNEKRDPVHPPIVQIIKNGKFELFQ
ncbi:MAG TPA: ABC transporter substrate-binding protein [Desulfomonilaceae bacterium]|nr:ABC transporter substrate-binding protein [Desulfomonilaceae bacterium]